MLKILPKNKSVRLAKGLTSLEFQCRCQYESCRSILVDTDLIKAYDKFRKLVDVRLTINSGYRCPAHNFDVGGKALSRHQMGHAIDISLKTLNHLPNNDIKDLAVSSGFTFILFYKTFVHMDARK